MRRKVELALALLGALALIVLLVHLQSDHALLHRTASDYWTRVLGLQRQATPANQAKPPQ